MAKVRLDQLLVERGLAHSRTRAQAMIMAGKVSSPGITQPKSGMLVDAQVELIINDDEGYVSRGAYKLIGALEHFCVDPVGLTCVDLGASTGGFTDVLLRRGARKVFALDVGKNLLDERLRHDPQVVVMDQTNARDLPDFDEPIDIVVCDVSFISLTKLMPALQALAKANPNIQLLLMVKPQFELDQSTVSKYRGVIRDDSLRREAIIRVTSSAQDFGFAADGEAFPAPLKGPKGNQEYFLSLKKA